MRVHVTAPGRGRPRHLVVTAPAHATTGELHAVLGAEEAPADPSAPLRHGYAVPGPMAGEPASAVRLVVSAGPDAGASVSLPAGRAVTVGRAPSCDLVVHDEALSRAHVQVRHERSGVVVEDLGSTNGLRWECPDAHPPEDHDSKDQQDEVGPAVSTAPWPPGATLEVGSSRLVLVLEPLPPVSGHEEEGRLVVTPWPRPRVPVEERRLASPAPPVPREVPRPSVWAWTLPLVAAGLLAAVLRTPTMLLFGLMAPAMLLGHHLGERRSARLDHRTATDRHRRALADVRAAAEQARRDELVRLRSAHPGLLGPVSALLPRPTAGLWSDAGGPPVTVLGEATALSQVSLDATPLRHPTAPLPLDLSTPLAVVGPRPLRDALARSLLLQVACRLPPSELSITVDPDATPTDSWDLLAWLPHTRPSTADVTGTTIAWQRPDGLLLLDDVTEAPAGTTQVLLGDARTAVLRRPGRDDVRFRPTLLGLPLARRLARTLAGLTDRAQGPAAAPSGASRLGDLLPWPTTPEDVRRAWASPSRSLAVPLGTDEHGTPFLVDLARDGPHALVAGTTGSGKSELLRTLVTGLALRLPPSELSLLLLDYKGGSSLGECAALPHTTGLVTDLDPHLAERVLVSLRAELHRREAVLARVGARDVRDHAGPDLPRLLVVIDEFRVLAEELPDFLGGLVRLAAVGRSLGVHLVLATQRPAGVVSADLRANVNLRIALRVRDTADSLDVVEVPDAAALPEHSPGLALLRTGSGAPRQVRVARVGPGAPPTRAEWEVDEVDGVWSGWRALHRPPAADVAEDGLGELPRLLADAAAGEGLAARPVWQAPLPDVIPLDTPGVWAVADRPDQQGREELRWDARSHLGVVGAARSGRTTAVRALLSAAGPVWLFVLDPARGLEGTEVARHPGLRGWVGPSDPAHAVRVLEVVDDLVSARLTAGPDPDRAPVVLVVDGWDRFLDAYGELRHGRARELALRVLRDGAAAGVVVLLTGDRSLLLGAVAAGLPETWALALHQPDDLALAGLRSSQIPRHQPPGRAVRLRDGLLAQVVLPAGDGPQPGPPPGTAPPRVVSLPASRPSDVPPGTWALGGDEAEPLPAPRPPLLVAGPPGSGVSTALASLARLLPGPGLRIDATSLGAPDDLARRLEDHDGPVVVDDAHLLAGSPVEDAVLAWAARASGPLLVGVELEAAGSAFRGLVPLVGRHRRGLVLSPSTPTHGGVLGVRLPVGDRPVPGRGVLVEAGRCTRVQVLPLSPPASESTAPSPGGP
ncbi:hypothetical protein GCM10009584_08530 [Ornithinimicrobium humiphilum]|nr:FtsK/SpoIIIE domain-containing protein [Ornithinimicrobium humiphilum]